MWRIEFSSAEWLPYLPEECQSNPGVYGFELAQWLSMALAQRSLVTSYPFQEDWGWLIEYHEGEVEVLIGCSSVCGEDEGYAGSAIAWSVFVEGIGLPTSRQAEAVVRLQDSICNALASKDIQFERVDA
jgi:hypothetical protein